MRNRARTAQIDPQARRLLSLEAIEALMSHASCSERASLAAEVRSRLGAQRYAMRLRAEKIEGHEQQAALLRVLQADAIAAERSLTLWLRLWAPEQAEEIERSTGAWPR